MTQEVSPDTPTTVDSLASVSTVMATPLPPSGLHHSRRRGSGHLLPSPLSAISPRGDMPLRLHSPVLRDSTSPLPQVKSTKKTPKTHRQIILDEKQKYDQQHQKIGPRMGREPLSILIDPSIPALRRKSHELQSTPLMIKTSKKKSSMTTTNKSRMPLNPLTNQDQQLPSALHLR